MKDRKRFKQQMGQAKATLDKELDFKRFIERQRLAHLAILSLLDSRQSFFASKLSRLVIKEEELSKKYSETEVSSGYSSGHYEAARKRAEEVVEAQRNRDRGRNKRTAIIEDKVVQ